MVRWDLDAEKFNLEMRNEHQNLYRQALDTWGEDAQINMAFEECSELMLALSHYRRALKEIRRDEIVEEIIDVSLMIEQLCMIFDISPVEWFAERDYKLKRLSDLLKQEK